MKYIFVTLSILVVWVSIILIINTVDTNEIVLSLIALFMTTFLYIVGFGDSI